MQPFDVVRLKVDIPDEGLRKGDIGAIVEILQQPRLAYEVEFTDEAGRTRAQVALISEQIELVPREDWERLKR